MENRFEVRGKTAIIYIPCRMIRPRTVEIEIPAIIDAKDLDVAAAFERWTVRRSSYGFYVTAKSIGLHQVILGMSHFIPGLEPDHIDRDPLNNRRSNLRLVTHSENCRNRSRHYDSFLVSLEDRIRPYVKER